MQLEQKTIDAIKEMVEQANAEDKKIRIFLDMDGTLAEYRTFESPEQYSQKNYFISLKPNRNVIDAIKLLMENIPELNIYTLSAYYDTPGNTAVEEKNEWLNKHFPEIKQENRIYTLCGRKKQEFIPNGICKYDILIDDYTENLLDWEVVKSNFGNGIAIKILNGLNSKQGTWNGPTVSHENSPEAIAQKLTNIIFHKEKIQDKAETVQLRNETKGLTMWVPMNQLSKVVKKHFSDYKDTNDFRKNFTNDDWNWLQRYFYASKDVVIEENTSEKMFKTETEMHFKQTSQRLNRIIAGRVEGVKETGRTVQEISDEISTFLEKYKPLTKKNDDFKRLYNQTARSFLSKLTEIEQTIEEVSREEIEKLQNSIKDAKRHIAENAEINVKETNKEENDFAETLLG